MNELTTTHTNGLARYPLPLDLMLEDDDETDDEDEAIVIPPRPDLMPAPIIKRARKPKPEPVELLDLNKTPPEAWPTRETPVWQGKDAAGRAIWGTKQTPVVFGTWEEVEEFCAAGPWRSWTDVGHSYWTRTVSHLKRFFYIEETDHGAEDINTCKVRRLLDAPGIGWKTAEAIAEARPFASWEDLEARRIHGVTPRRIAALRAIFKMVVKRP